MATSNRKTRTILTSMAAKTKKEKKTWTAATPSRTTARATTKKMKTRRGMKKRTQRNRAPNRKLPSAKDKATSTTAAALPKDKNENQKCVKFS